MKSISTAPSRCTSDCFANFMTKSSPKSPARHYYYYYYYYYFLLPIIIKLESTPLTTTTRYYTMRCGSFTTRRTSPT